MTDIAKAGPVPGYPPELVQLHHLAQFKGRIRATVYFHRHGATPLYVADVVGRSRDELNENAACAIETRIEDGDLPAYLSTKPAVSSGEQARFQRDQYGKVGCDGPPLDGTAEDLLGWMKAHGLVTGGDPKLRQGGRVLLDALTKIGAHSTVGS